MWLCLSSVIFIGRMPIFHICILALIKWWCILTFRGGPCEKNLIEWVFPPMRVWWFSMSIAEWVNVHCPVFLSTRDWSRLVMRPLRLYNNSRVQTNIVDWFLEGSLSLGKLHKTTIPPQPMYVYTGNVNKCRSA